MSKPELVQLTHKEWMASTSAKAAQHDLTAEEKARPFSKYFYEDIPQPDPEHYAMMEEPCDPAKALLPEDRNKLLDPGYLDVEIGWCNLPTERDSSPTRSYTRM